MCKLCHTISEMGFPLLKNCKINRFSWMLALILDGLEMIKEFWEYMLVDNQLIALQIKECSIARRERSLMKMMLDPTKKVFTMKILGSF